MFVGNTRGKPTAAKPPDLRPQECSGPDGSPRRSRPASASLSPALNTARGGHRCGVLDGAIFSNAAWYGPVGASQASLSGERSASFCSEANTWNSTQPTEKVTHCAAGSRSASYRHAAWTDAGMSEVLRPPIHTRLPGGCIRES